MSFSLKSFIAKDYWFTLPTSLKEETAVLYLTVLGAMFLLGIVVKIASGRKGLRAYMRVCFNRFGNLFLSGAVVGGLFLFFRYQYVPMLSWRMWFGIWLLWLLAWGVFIIRHWFMQAKVTAEKIAQFGDREKIEAYLPKRKK